jgi:hypothetical protein
MADLSKVPVSNRIVLSDDPIYAGRSASILVANRFLPQVLAHLLKKNIFFAVTPYKGGVSGVACQMGNAHTLAEAVERAEKRKQ